MHDFVRTGGSVNSVWKQFSLQVEWGIKWNLDRIIFITLEWMILEFIAYKEGKKKIYWYLIKLLAKLEGHIVSRPPAKPKQSQFAKYRNTPLDIDFQCTISLCQFSHVKPPRKRSRTTNDRLWIFLLIHTHTHAHRALVTWILRQNQAGTVTQEEHMSQIMSFAESVHSCSTRLSTCCNAKLWAMSGSQLAQNLGWFHLHQPEMYHLWPQRGNYPGTETTCNRMCRLEVL